MPCHATNAKGEPCKFKTKADYCRVHAQQGNGVVTDMMKTAGKAALNLAKKVAAPITRRINAIREGPASKPTGRLAAFLEKTSSKKVVKMELGRKPILHPVHKAMDALSLGKFSQRQKQLDYDEVFHNYTLYTLEDGSKWKMEKSAVVAVFEATDNDYKGELFDIPLQGKELTLKSMIDTAAKDNATGFWKYRADSNNCQRFTRDMIEKNGLMPEVEEKHHKVQDSQALTDSLPPATHHIPNFVTDLAVVSDRLLHGDEVGKTKQKAIRAMLFARN